MTKIDHTEAQNYIIVASQCKESVEVCIKELSDQNLVHKEVWIKNLINARDIIQDQLKKMWIREKKAISKDASWLDISFIYFHALNVSSIIPLVIQNYNNGIKDLNPMLIQDILEVNILKDCSEKNELISYIVDE